MQPVCPVLVTGMLRSADLCYRCRSVPYPVPKTGTCLDLLSGWQREVYVICFLIGGCCLTGPQHASATVSGWSLLAKAVTNMLWWVWLLLGWVWRRPYCVVQVVLASGASLTMVALLR
jgi:hypothetical protein